MNNAKKIVCGAVLGGGIGLGAAMFIGGSEKAPEGCAIDVNEPAACVAFNKHQTENELFSSDGFKVVVTLGMASIMAATFYDTGPLKVKPQHDSERPKIDSEV